MAEQHFDVPLGDTPYDAYMQIDGHPGESTDSKHAEWIEIKQYRHAIDQKITASFSASGAPTAGQATHGYFWVCKELDKASPKLQLSMLQGSPVSEIKMELCTQAGDKTPFLNVKLESCVIASIHTAGALIPTGIEAIPISKPCEWVGIAYGKITWTYTALDPKTGAGIGDVESFWDRGDNTGG